MDKKNATSLMRNSTDRCAGPLGVYFSAFSLVYLVWLH